MLNLEKCSNLEKVRKVHLFFILQHLSTLIPQKMGNKGTTIKKIIRLFLNSLIWNKGTGILLLLMYVPVMGTNKYKRWFMNGNGGVGFCFSIKLNGQAQGHEGEK